MTDLWALPDAERRALASKNRPATQGMMTLFVQNGQGIVLRGFEEPPRNAGDDDRLARSIVPEFEVLPSKNRPATQGMMTQR